MRTSGGDVFGRHRVAFVFDLHLVGADPRSKGAGMALAELVLEKLK
jgi:hypothetical protein